MRLFHFLKNWSDFTETNWGFYFSLVCAIQPTYENKTYHFLFVLHTLQNLWFVVDRELDELLRHWRSGFFVPRCHMFSCPRSFIIVIGHHVLFSIFICIEKTELNDSSILLTIIFRLWFRFLQFLSPHNDAASEPWLTELEQRCRNLENVSAQRFQTNY